jgi:hypothetical protein
MSPLALNATVVNEGVYQLLVHIWLKVMGFLTANSSNLLRFWGGLFSILEVAVDPSYTIFFLGALQKPLFCSARLGWVATGCITILQAVRLQKRSVRSFALSGPPSPYLKEPTLLFYPSRPLLNNPLKQQPLKHRQPRNPKRNPRTLRIIRQVR